MHRIALSQPYLVVVACLIVAILGVTTITRMPVDLFPRIDIPVVVVATFFTGMPPEQVEADITGRFERFFTLASSVEHIESRSLPGVSLIKIVFQPGTDPDSAVTNISNLAMANLRRLPPGTLPPVVLKFDSSSLPVCLIALKGAGLSETQLRDTAQYAVRNQVANVPGASVPQPFGGRYRQIMVYVDPLRLEAHQLSPMDVVRAVNDANMILPAGDIRIGPLNYSIYTNSQVERIAEIDKIPLKTIGSNAVFVGSVGKATDAHQIQNNIVHVDGQPSVYLPVLKQGGNTNTIAVVSGIKSAVANLVDVPAELAASVVFDQSEFVRGAIRTLVVASIIGLFLTALLVLAFLARWQAVAAVLLSVPLSVMAAMLVLSAAGQSINSMLLGGLALAFTRLLFNSLVVLESIFRYSESGESPEDAARLGAADAAAPVLGATLTTVIVFFPVILLHGVSKFLFTALGMSTAVALFASYFIALTVIPLFSARYLGRANGSRRPSRVMRSIADAFSSALQQCTDRYERLVSRTLARPMIVLIAATAGFVASLALYPKLPIAFFPRIDPGQFVINVKAQPGTRLEATQEQVRALETLIREVVPPHEVDVIVSNIGVTPGFSSIYTSNSAQHTAFIQVNLQPEHTRSTYEYIDDVRARARSEMPHLSTFFRTGGLADAVLNMGAPAPIDVQVSGMDLRVAHETARLIGARVSELAGVSDVFIPQDLDYPALQIDVDRIRAAKMGLNQKEVVQNVLTALVSNQMIAPSYWVDHSTGNDYLLTVQYLDNQVKSLEDVKAIPLRPPLATSSARLEAVSNIKRIQSPTEVDHYQLRRVMNVYVSPSGEDLGAVAAAIENIIREQHIPDSIRVDLRGMVQGMRSSFSSFAAGISLAVILLYLILIAQFRSFTDPLVIISAIPLGLSGVLAMLYLSGSTLNVMSLMGIVMMVGIVVSNSILLVGTANRLDQARPARERILLASRQCFRPVVMTSLATVVGLLPLAFNVGVGGEAYVPMARAIMAGMLASLLTGVFTVPAAYYLLHSGDNRVGSEA